jgi:uncharacterized iron-regulated membrane protein
MMWWWRRPKGRLGTPPMPSDKRFVAGLLILVVVLGVLLPMAGVTLLAALFVDALLSGVWRLRLDAD